MKHIKLLLILIIVFCIKSPSFSDGDFMWLKVSGHWNIDNASHSLIDSASSRPAFGYNDLNDTNSIVSLNSFDTFTSITCDFLLHAPEENNNFTLVFSVSNYSRNFYGIRFHGTKKGINRIALIRSNSINDALPSKEKNNFVIENLTDSDINLSYDSPVQLRLLRLKSKLKVLVNGKTAIEYSLNCKLPAGNFGISHINNLVQIKSFSVLNGKKTIFTDDFSSNRIKTMKIIIKKEDK